MALHYQIIGKYAIHPFAFVSETDPALDAANHVSAFKGWVKLSTKQLFFRNATNDSWELVGAF